MRTALAIDTSGATCSAALWETRENSGGSGSNPHDPEGVVLGSIRYPMARGHAEALLPLIETLLKRTSRRPADIDLIGVVHGPGAFTGLRIGLAAAAGLSLATGAPIVGVNAFDTFAEGAVGGLDTAPPEENQVSACTVTVAIDSRRREMYLRSYRAERGAKGWSLGSGDAMICVPPASAALPALLPIWVAGSGARRFCDDHPALSANNRCAPEAIDAGIVAKLAWRARASASPDLPDPLYLRPPDAVVAAPARGITDPTEPSPNPNRHLHGPLP